MTSFILWLENMTLGETIIFVYCCIFGLGLLIAPIAWYIDKKTNGRDK